MGGIASVHVRAGSEAAASQPSEEQIAEEIKSQSDLETANWRRSSDGGEEGTQPKLLEVRVTSSLPVEEREAEMGRVIQYLAEENVTLKRKNFQLEAQLQSSQNAMPVIQPDIYGETDEGKIRRLENTLAVERAEKWGAIEHSEKCRVDLVNSEIKLVETISAKEKLDDEVRTAKRQIRDLNEVIERLKSRPTEEKEVLRTDERSQVEAQSSSCRMEPEDMTAFRAQLKEKRDARQKAIAAKSLEMNQVRDDLKKERVLREKLERELHRLKKCRTGTETDSEIQLEKETLMDEIAELKQSLLATGSVREENKKLFEEIKTLNYDIRQLNTTILQRDNDLKESKRKYDRLVRDQGDLQKENERSKERQKEIEEEQKKMWEEYDKEKGEIAKRTLAMKDVIAISRQMLLIREKQVVDLKKKLKEIEDSLSEKQRLEDSVLKVEYEKQLENIKLLKALYEERLTLMEAEKKKLADKILDDAKAMDDLKNELSDLTTKYEMVGEELDTEKQGNISLTKELDNWVAQAHSYERELSLMNNLLTQMLVGPHGADLDKLTEQLQQNHALIAEMTTCEDCSDVASALPKMLLDLIARVEENEDKNGDCEKLIAQPSVIRDPMTDSTDTISEQSEGLLADNAGAVLPIVSYRNATVFKPPASPPLTTESHDPKEVKAESAEEGAEHATTHLEGPAFVDPSVQVIVSNLPKVWKVLTELLSHHSAPEGPPIGDERNCYKNVDTPNGPRSVISVSNTFLRLKDLILEKKYLQKEVYRLKHLNTHLESRLDDQEKRLSTVRCELHKTWGVVGRMRAQHQQLHNQEKILRYELQEKRVMLTELKQELEYCRDKWDRARRKNNETEIEWRKLRKEFTARKLVDAGGHDSGESGYSDEQNDSDDAARSTPSPVDFVNAAQVLEAVSSQPVSSIDVVVTDQEVVISYDMEQPLLERVAIPDDGDPEEAVVFSSDCPSPDDKSLQPVSSEEGASAAEPTSEGAGKPLDEAIKDSTANESSAKIVLVSDEDRERARDERARRLQRLEDQCQLLVRKVDITTHRSNFLSNRLEELHEQYGGNDNNDAAAASTPNHSVGTSGSKCQKETETDTTCLVKEQERKTANDSSIIHVEREETPAQVLETLESTNDLIEAAVSDEVANVGTSLTSVSHEGALKELAGMLDNTKETFPNSNSCSESSGNQGPIPHPTELCRELLISASSSKKDSEKVPCSKNTPNREITPLKNLEVATSVNKNETIIESSETSIVDNTNCLIMAPHEGALHELHTQKTSVQGVSSSSISSEANVQEETMSLQLTLDPNEASRLGESTKGTSAEPEESSKGNQDSNLKKVLIPVPESLNRTPQESASVVELPLAHLEHDTRQSETVAREMSLATFDERMAARAAKLKRLEEQCSSLYGKVSSTVQRGTDLSTRLEEIHNGYVNSESRLNASPAATSEAGGENENSKEVALADDEAGTSGEMPDERIFKSDDDSKK